MGNAPEFARLSKWIGRTGAVTMMATATYSN